MNKKADILHENVIFIVLNVLFFSILILFIYFQGSSVSLEEEELAKQIALVIDSSKPGVQIKVNLESFFEKLDDFDVETSVEIDNDKNLVIVKASEDSSYEYSYFNNVNVEWGFDGDYLDLLIK